MPEAFPLDGYDLIDVTPDLGTAFARTVGGLVITSRNSDPFWRGRIETGPLEGFGEDNRHADFLAWLNRVADLNIRVDFIHPRHRLPRHYNAATWPMVANANLEAVTDLRTISVSGLINGLILKRGDRLSLVQDDIVCCRWIAEDTIVSSTLAQALSLTPRLPIGVFAANATVVLEDPKLRFMVVPNSWQAAEGYKPSSISFEVEEALR